MHAPINRIFLAAVIAVAAATAVSAATELDVVKEAADAASRIDFSAVNANLVANVNALQSRFPFTEGSSHGTSVVRGRSLAQTALCEVHKEDGGTECTPGKAAMENFRPATPEGQVRDGREGARRRFDLYKTFFFFFLLLWHFN